MKLSSFKTRSKSILNLFNPLFLCLTSMIFLSSYTQGAEKCSIDATFTSGKYVLHNDLWNMPSGGWGCIRSNSGGFLTNGIIGWDTKTSSNSGGVKIYQALKIGYWDWWDRDDKTSSLSKKVKNLPQIWTEYNISGWRGGKCNLAFDLWLHTGSNPSRNNLKLEIMIWEKAWGGMSPTGFSTKVGDLYHQYSNYKVYQDQYSNWQILYFVRENGRTKGWMELRDFINWAKNNGYISQEHYLTAINLGHEVVHGGGWTNINKFKIHAF